LSIEEEGKSAGNIAPLAEAEDEDLIENIPEPRPSIDRPVPQPKRADAVQAERETTESKALPRDDIDAKLAEKRKSATVFLQLSQPGFERRPDETTEQTNKRASEHDDRIEESRRDEKLVSTQQAVPIDNKQV
jgi:hypothetical protein